MPAGHSWPKDAVLINSNENPLGPCTVAREAVIAITPESGRYHDHAHRRVHLRFRRDAGLKPEYVQPHAGSSRPAALYGAGLHFAASASYVTADPDTRPACTPPMLPERGW